MCQFYSQATLDAQYEVYGLFYDVRLAANKNIPCRSVLEIVDWSGGQVNVPALSYSPVDALFIMMNPGSSRPKNTVPQQIHRDTTKNRTSRTVRHRRHSEHRLRQVQKPVYFKSPFCCGARPRRLGDSRRLQPQGRIVAT